MKLFNKYNQPSPNQEKNSAILQHCVTATLIATLSAFLSGCMGVYEGGFECPAGIGVGCKSISEVNEMVNKGLVPTEIITTGELPQNASQTHHEFTDEPSKCPTCGYSFPSIHGKPEIWINPLYLKSQKEQIQSIDPKQEKRRRRVIDA